MLLNLLFFASVFMLGFGRLTKETSQSMSGDLSVEIQSRYYIHYPKNKNTLPEVRCNPEKLKNEDSLTGILVKNIPRLENEFGRRVKLTFIEGFLTSCELVPIDILRQEVCVPSPIISTPGLICKEGWTLIDSSCFLLFKTEVTWAEGQTICEKSGGSLAIVTTPLQQAVLASQVNSDTWIGLNDIEDEGKFIWTDGSSSNYTNWAEDQPDNGWVFGSEENCVDMKKQYNFFWNDEDCSDKNRFICSYPAEPAPTTTTTTTTTTVPPTCQDGWQQRELSCYKASEGQATWNNAHDACDALGAKLASITSEEEQDFVAGLLDASGWIGLNDLELEGTFVWEDGSEVTYSKWGKGEPNDGSVFGFSEDCVEMKKSLGYDWNDENCSDKYKYVCERPAE